MAAGKTRPFYQQGPTGLVYAAVAADQWLGDGEGITPLAVCLPPPPPPTVYLLSFIVPSAGLLDVFALHSDLMCNNVTSLHPELFMCGERGEGKREMRKLATNLGLKMYCSLSCRVATAQGKQGKQGIWFLLFPDRENTGNFALTQGKILRHRENIFL